MVTQFTSEDYPWLCDACKAQLDQLAELFNDDFFPDTDDNEAASMMMYDEQLYCGGDTCINGDKQE